MTDHIEDSPIKKKNRGGWPPNSIWEDINKGEASRDEVSKLEEHLSNHCPDTSAAVISPSHPKKKYFENQSNIDDYHDSTELNKQRCTRINRALVKFFIVCRIAFRIVKHLFLINFIKELNTRYNTPTRELEKETNLTLAFDGWTSGTHCSIWNFIVMTSSRKKYLYQLFDLSENSHTAEYLVTVIEKVIEGIGEDRICAVVSDNAANEKSSHQANAKLAQIIKEKRISGRGLKLYCKTHWTTASESINSVINLESALEEMASDHDKVLTNDKIKLIIQSRNFFSNLRVLGFVLDSLRKAVLSLESRRATLADYFLNLARLAAILKSYPNH
ncbi:ribonuclease H-like domain-containing protein [Rhizophagus irregularis DAOM 181602=DAOM 197198]|nr:ribonuclease H-like domain-containing protein [Rhizophagus irregularis DAOM 181602=DAOM 197198]